MFGFSYFQANVAQIKVNLLHGCKESLNPPEFIPQCFPFLTQGVKKNPLVAVEFLPVSSHHKGKESHLLEK